MKNSSLKDKKHDKSKGSDNSDDDSGKTSNKDKKSKGKVQIKEENNTVLEHDPNEKAAQIKSKLDTSLEHAESLKNKDKKENDPKQSLSNRSKEKAQKYLTDNTKVVKHKEYFENIRVLIRSRPLNKNELGKGTSVYLDPTDDKKVKIGKDSQFFEATFDKVFSGFILQEEIFNYLSPAIDRVLIGFNCTIFTYGQTGSGKTYTMFGGDWTRFDKLDGLPISSSNKLTKKKNEDDFFDFTVNPYSEDNGIIPRAIEYIYSEVEIKNLDKKVYQIYVSFLQIYNEKILDLLYVKNEDETDENQKKLEIKEDKENGIIVEGLSEHLTDNLFDCFNLLKKGEKNRKRRQTKKNDVSSRSHTIFQIIIQMEDELLKGKFKRTKLNLCDLAGSEKLEKGDEMIEKMHFNEMVNINLSLTNLGKVIHALATKQSHIPYRDSKLTRLLQDSLGGNTITYLISTLSPSIVSYDETISTLKFSDRAKNVMTKVKPTESNNPRNEGIIKKLKEEIAEYKNILNLRKKRGNFNELEDEVLKLKTENTKLKQYMISNSDLERLVEENKSLKKEITKYKPEYFEQKERNYEDELINNEKYYLDTLNMQKNDFEKSESEKNHFNDQNQAEYYNSDYYNDSYLEKSMSHMSGSNNIVKKKRNSPKKYEINNKYMNNHFYGVRSRSNMIKSGEMIVGQSYSKNKDKDLKMINDRLRILEKLEIETGLNLEKEKEKAKYQKYLINEEFSQKGSNRPQRNNQMEEHLNKIKYLYNDSRNDEGDYKNINQDNKRNNYNIKYYDEIINNNDREYLESSFSKEKNKSYQNEKIGKDMMSKENDKSTSKNINESIIDNSKKNNSQNDNSNINLKENDKKNTKEEKNANNKKDNLSKKGDFNDKTKETIDSKISESTKKNEKSEGVKAGEASKK